MPAEEQRLNALLELGEEVRAKREKLGLTPDDVYEESYIRADYIEGIEQGDYKNLPDTVFTLGFIRAYLNFLELDELYPEFSDYLKKRTRGTERHREVFGQYSPPPSGFKLASRFWIFTVMILVVLGAVSYVAYSWSKNGIPDIMKRNEPARQQPQTNNTQAAVVSDEPISEDKAPVAVIPPPREEIPVREEPVKKPELPGELKIYALDDCWLSVRVGEKNDQMTLKKGESYTAKLTEMARVTFGRPWSVTVTLNGKNLGSPFKGGVQRTEAHFYTPDGKNGKIDPAPNRNANANTPR